MTTWAILTGEYPPQLGGVSDYTRLVANGLAAAGDEVHVWAPPCAEGPPDDPGVSVHRLPDHFGFKSRGVLNRQLKRLAQPYRLLVQYVPHAFGWKALNVPFCHWLLRRQEPVWVMFHEVAFPLGWSQPLRHNLLGFGTRWMASMNGRAAQRCFVSIPAWERLLRRIGLVQVPITWLPVPSNLPTQVSGEAVRTLRYRLAADSDMMLVGHFGTYGELIAGILQEILPTVLKRDPKRLALLIGKNSQRFRQQLVKNHEELADRVVAVEGLSRDQVAAHLAACDCLVQPYPDGASSRRSSLMGGLALGAPIVTNQGPLSEAIWGQSQAVRFLPEYAPAAFTAAVDSLLANADDRRLLRARAKDLYQSRFALEHTIRTLQECREAAKTQKVA
jgi:glycosyltransferase involved in cell wall biosynthesis